jgi:predicted DNA-binding transcriptional regulator AlpA
MQTPFLLLPFEMTASTTRSLSTRSEAPTVPLRRALPNQSRGAVAMDVQLITKVELLKLVPYSIRHIYRMEKVAKFPARVRVVANRVAWVHSDVMRWLELRVAARIEPEPAPDQPAF